MSPLRRRHDRRRHASALALLLAVGLTAAVPTAQADPPAPDGVATSPSAAAAREKRDRDVVRPEVTRRLQGALKDRKVKVIVSLDVAKTGAAPPPAAVRSAADEVVEDLPGGSYAVRSHFDRIPALSLSVDAAALDALARNPRVTAVNEDHVVSLQMTQANALAEVPAVHASGITGEGVVVAVIDTGVDSNVGVVHPGLADDLLGQACFRTENDCIGGAVSAEDQHGHGTHVTGIITGPEGAAPDTGFHALKVFTTGSTSDTNILNSLDHVIGLNTTTPGAVDLVNMSLGGGSYQTQLACDADNTAYVAAFSALNAQGTTILVATGNEGTLNAVASPACVTGAVGVGSVGDGNNTINFSNCTDHGAPDKVTCFSNTTPVQGAGELVDVLAPGCLITSTWLDGGMNSICGTSMASPFAAGVAALALEAAALSGTPMTPALLEQLLESTGDPVNDYRLLPGAPTFPRVNAAAAVGTMTIDAPSTGVPDARIKKGSQLIGNNVYGGPAKQTAAAKVRARKKVTFVVTVQNDAEVAERLRVRGTKSSPRFKVTYRTAAGNVTQQVRAGTLRTPLLAPGATFAINVVVTATKKATKKSKIRGAVTATSTAVPTAADTVGFLVRRR